MLRFWRSAAARTVLGASGGLLLAGITGVALVQAAAADDGEVSVEVEIGSVDEPGVLALSVSADSTVLEENGSTATVRQFSGALPTVTVTDTRSAEEIPDEAWWSVTGVASNFAGDAEQPDITADHLGWTPRLIDGGESGGVSEGEPVDTVLDEGPDNVGLEGQELLAMAWNSGEIAGEGQWTATADLLLKVPAAVESGRYTSMLTLSLFE